MKRILFLLAFTPLFSISQVKVEKPVTEKSKIETFALKTGSLIKKEFIDVGEVKKVEIQVVKISDIIAKSTIAGIKLTTSISKSYGNVDKSCFLDLDEIDGFVRSGKLLLESLSDNPDNYTEYQFTSRGGFQAGAYLSKKEWKYFLKLEQYDSDSYVFLERKDYEAIISSIESAKAKLQ